MNPGSQSHILAAKWIDQDPLVIGNTVFQEDLTAMIISAGLSYMRGIALIPARLEANEQNSAVDRVIVDASEVAFSKNSVSGSQIQIVSTYGEKLDNVDAINKIILGRVEKKHSRGIGYSENVNLAVLVTQDDWKVDINELVEKIFKERRYEGYWIILPLMTDGKHARFAVNYLYPEQEHSKRGEAQLVVDITDEVEVRHLYFYGQDGMLDNLVEYLKFKHKADKVS